MARSLVALTPSVIYSTRQSMSMTQREFGEWLGVEENTVYRWEAGIHLPVGKRKQTILNRYRAIGKRNRRIKAFDAEEAFTEITEADFAKLKEQYAPYDALYEAEERYVEAEVLGA